MNIQHIEDSQVPSVPLPLYSAIHIANAESKDGTKFVVYVGMNEEVVRQLKAYSLDVSDEGIQRYTSDRARFGEGDYEAWYEKGRVPFALIEESSGRVAALAWIGESPLGDDADNWHTIAYRAYGEYRGKGIMKGFVQYAIDQYTQYYPGAKIWASIALANEASAGLGRALGFVDFKRTEEKLTMIKK